jgi:ubiquinone/menaquinone biosynthesis C-methylase UbiE
VPDVYTHGHHDSVLRSHRWRDAANSAAYLLPHLSPGMTLLDVGCGPGTITLDLAARLAPGAVTGIDASADVVAEAEARRQRALAKGAPGAATTTFTTGDVYALGHDDAGFDVVHAHQVLQHLTDPVAALGEMRRVLRPGGVLAVRDGDYGAFAWSPADPELDRWLALYHRVTARNGGDADAGRHLLGWVRRAGFDDAVYTSSTWTFAEPDSRAWWSALWAERVAAPDSAFARQALDYGFATAGELAAMAGAWRRWASHNDAVFVVPHGEVLARAPGG